MRPPVFQKIANSQFAGLAAVKLNKDEVVYLKNDELVALEAAGQTFSKVAAETAKTVLDSIKPRWLRDKAKVIQCAIFESDSPLTASIVLAPNFLDQFVDVFGPEVIVAIPTRTKVYVFPKVANRIAAYVPDILSDYRAAAYPISPEAFEVGPRGIFAVSELDDR